MSGRGDPTGLTYAYAGLPNQRMIRNNDYRILPIAEPTGIGSAPTIGVGPMGLFGARRAVRKSKPMCIVNGGRGGAKAAQWVPGAGTLYYENMLFMAQVALSQPGAYLGGYVLYDGLNDAVDASPTWLSNWTSTIATLKSALGNAPLYICRYPPTVPTDMAYPSHAALRATIAGAAFAAGVVDAPDGPWVEAYKLHLNTPANEALSALVDAAVP